MGGGQDQGRRDNGSTTTERKGKRDHVRKAILCMNNSRVNSGQSKSFQGNGASIALKEKNA